MTNLITQMLWLTLNTYFEGRGENLEGQKAICHVTLNRMREDGVSVKEVVTQPKQFSWVDDNIPDAIRDFNALTKCSEAVMECLSDRLTGENLGGANHYYNPHKVSKPYWAKNMKVITEIGDHIFLIGNRGSGSHHRSFKKSQ